MNDVVDLALGAFMVLWSLSLIAAVVIAVVFLVRLRRESVLNARRRQANAELARERAKETPADR